MTEKARITSILTAHFFRRFFDNDTVHVDGDTQTTVVRAVAIVMVPGMMVAFYLQNHYPQRPFWGAIEDKYFFVLLSFVVMGAVAIFEWEMLFPDRLDFLVLSPLPLRPAQMLTAKITALTGFLALFLFASNVFGTIMLPAVSKGNFLRQIYAHGIAVLMAGTFAALFFLAIGGLLLCILDAARFRLASPILQMVSTLALALLVLHYALYGDSLEALLTHPLGVVRWIPPFWFLGVYEKLLYGNATPPFAQLLAHYAIRANLIAGAVILLTYPLAWTRRRRMSVEGSSHPRHRSSRIVAFAVHALVRRPQERAVFHFIGQTIVRNSRYQVYLAIYSGTGLALAIACAITVRVSGNTLHPSLSAPGLHAIMPLLLFWVIAGLRTAFAFPLDLAAGWIFRIASSNVAGCAAAARKWMFLCASGVTASVLIALRLARWDPRHLLVQAVFGLCLCILLTDGFFSIHQSVPFNRPRMPGRTSFPLMLTLYLGVFPTFVLWIVHLELDMEKNLLDLLILAVVTAAIHATFAVLRSGPQEVEEEMEGYDGEFQLLGLS